MLSAWACVCVLECVWLIRPCAAYLCYRDRHTQSRLPHLFTPRHPPLSGFDFALIYFYEETTGMMCGSSLLEKKHIWLKSRLGSNVYIHYRSDSKCVCMPLCVSVVISTGNPRVISHTAQWQEVHAVMGRYDIHFQLSPYPWTTTADRSTVPWYRHLFISE